MIKSFFQSLEEHRVAYLLISGQATILYGAATFSEDIDLWVEPSAANARRLRAALATTGARYYKLTPPLQSVYLKSGHGFHFCIGDDAAEEFFLDVLGKPPRVRSFAAAVRRCSRFSTEWGTIPTVGLRDLVELKKTQRLADYPVISALTLRALREASPSTDLAWAAVNLFTVESFFYFNQRYPAWVKAAPAGLPSSIIAAAGLPLAEIDEKTIADATRWFGSTMLRHQRADREYWRGIIAELRQLRRNRKLMREGMLVAAL
jgi:hypothetical protein